MIGFLVQAATEIAEENFNGVARWVHAKERGVGHVLDVMPDPEWLFVFFDRTGTKTIVHISELIILGPPTTGR